MLDLKIKLLSSTAMLPTKSHPTDACFDIYADVGLGEENEIIIEPGKTVKIKTGFATNIPHGYYAAVYARSGLATKSGLRPANCVAVIDEPYTGEWIIPIYNDSGCYRTIHHGDRIAQFTLLPYYDTNLIVVDSLEETDRGKGGFGSTGK